MPMTETDLIHPTAVIDPAAEIAANVQIGPYAIVEGAVRIGSGCIVESHACLSGPMTLGADNPWPTARPRQKPSAQGLSRRGNDAHHWRWERVPRACHCSSRHGAGARRDPDRG